MARPGFVYVRDFTSSPRLVLDVRDWYAGEVRPDALRAVGVPNPAGGTEALTVRAVVRPTRPLTVTAEPAVPREPGWPFPGPVELVTPVTPSGLRAFFGRVRSPDGGPLRRVPLLATACRLTVRGDGYEPAVVSRVAIPGRDEPTAVVRVDLTPGPDLPPGPTEVAGGVFKADGSPEPRAVVTLKAAGMDDVETQADAAGLWRAELPELAGPHPVAVTVEVTTNGPAVVLNPPLQVRPGRANRVPLTVLRGVVRRAATGGPVGGAEVTVAGLAGRTTTRADGTWVYYPPRTEPLAGEFVATVRVQRVAGGPVTEADVRVFRGESNTAPVIQV